MSELFQRRSHCESHTVVCTNECVGEGESRFHKGVYSHFAVVALEIAVEYALLVNGETVFLHSADKGVISGFSVRVAERSRNIVYCFCAVVLNDMVHELLHNTEVVDAYIIEIRIFMVLENNGRDTCVEDFSENAVSKFGIAEGVGHQDSAVESGIINEIVDTALADVKGGTADHSSEACNIGDIHIIAVGIGADTLENVMLVFFIKSRDYNNYFFSSVFIHEIPSFV